MAHCLKHKGNYSDEFWMLSFKVVPCTKTYAHSWSSCPCAHPGETARRRDPTLFNYQPVLCPNVKSKSGCPAGDSCGYAHNVFEQWLHPQRYKALMCTYGSQCTRPSCFFAHSLEELRVPWKGGPGSTAGGEQQQQQLQQQQQSLQQQSRGSGSSENHGDIDAAGGMGGQLGAGIGAGIGGGGGADLDVARSSSVSGHAAAAAAAAAAGVASGSGRSRLLLQAAGGLQQQLQLQHGQGAGGLMPAGGGVVDVRVVAGGSGHQSLSGDHSFPYQLQQHQLQQQQQQQQLRGGGGGNSGTVQLQRRPSISTTSASAPYDLETATSVPVDSTSMSLVSGAPNQPGQLYRSHSNGSTLYGGLTEEVPLAGPGGTTTGLAGGHSTTVSGSLAAGAGGGASGAAADGAVGLTESTSATSIYQTPLSTGQHTLTVSGMGSMGVYGDSNAAAGGGGGELGGGSAAAAGPGMPGGRPLPLGAPQLQQHLQQLHQHQQQMQLQQQQQQQQMQVPRMKLQQQQSLTAPFRLKEMLGAGGGTGSAPGAWLTQAQTPPPQLQQQQSVGLEFGQAGGTASLDYTGAPPNSTTLGMHSSGLLDMSEEIEPGLLSGWVPVQLPSQQQQQPQGKQSLPLGAPGAFGSSGSSGQRLSVPRSFSAVLPDESAASAAAAQQAAEAVRQQVQKLQVGGPGVQQVGPDAAAAGILGGPLGDGGGGLSQGVFADAGRPGFRRHTSTGLNFPPSAGAPPPPTSTSPAPPPDLHGGGGAAAASTARIDPDVEMLLLSSLQLQLNHAGVSSQPVVGSFPVRNWLRQALQGRAQAATRMYLLDLLAAYMPPDQLAVIRRLVDCLEDAGALLSCFAGPPAGAGVGIGVAAPGGAAAAPPGGTGGAGGGVGPA